MGTGKRQESSFPKAQPEKSKINAFYTIPIIRYPQAPAKSGVGVLEEAGMAENQQGAVMLAFLSSVL